MKPIVFVLFCIFLAGCENSANIMHPKVIPDELKDCTFHKIYTSGREIIVVRCPLSATSVMWRKPAWKASAHKYSITVSET